MKDTFKRIIKIFIPAMVRRWIRQQKLYWAERPPSGLVRFGSFRRLVPISRLMGFARGQPVDRYYIENFILNYAGDVQGHVLEVGDNTYTQKFGGEKVHKSDVLNIRKDANGMTTIEADLSQADHIPSDIFDCIIFTQTLQFIYDVRAALKTLYRILKPGGVLLVTFPGISQISRFDMDRWGDYWRFTNLSAHKLFTEIFSENHVAVQTYGNVLAAIGLLHGLSSKELKKEELNSHDPDYEVIITVRAVKSEKNEY